MKTILSDDERNRIIDSMGWSLDDQERGDMHMLIQAVLAKLVQRAEPFNAAKIPEGYQLVPIERDHNMRCSAIAAYNVQWVSRKTLGEVLDAVWAAQLKDAPEPPMAEAVSIEELEHEMRLVRARNERLEKESAETHGLLRQLRDQVKHMLDDLILCGTDQSGLPQYMAQNDLLFTNMVAALMRLMPVVDASIAAAPEAPAQVAEPVRDERGPSPTSGMTLWQRILHVGGRTNAAGYVEFGSVQAVDALMRHVLRDLPDAAPEAPASQSAAEVHGCHGGDDSTLPSQQNDQTKYFLDPNVSTTLEFTDGIDEAPAQQPTSKE